MKVLVTGGTGFIGANLVRHLLAAGDTVRCLVRQPRLTLAGLDVELVRTPIRDDPASIEALARTLDGCEGVYHLAGLFDPGPGGIERMRFIHVDATRVLLRAMELAGCRRMVLCSSSITVGFGPREAPGDEDTPLDVDRTMGLAGPLRAYHDTKLEAEGLARAGGPVEVVVVNPDYIIGAWDVKPTSGQLIVAMGRRPMPLHPRGGKCFQGADDCAVGHIAAMERGLPGRRYLLGHENLTYKEFMTQVAQVLGVRPPRWPVPDAAISLVGRVGALGQRFDAHRFAGLDGRVLRAMQQERFRSGRRAWTELGVPRTPVIEGIEKAVKWFREHSYL